MEWRNPRRFGAEDNVVLMRELSIHKSRSLGSLMTVEDRTRVLAEGQASYEAALARAREHMMAVRRKLMRRSRRRCG